MKLVGASSLQIRAPALLEAAMIGALGSLLAVAALALVRELIARSAHSSPGLAPFAYWPTLWYTAAEILGVGLIASVVASSLTLRRHIRT